jgi:competence protein ComEC
VFYREEADSASPLAANEKASGNVVSKFVHLVKTSFTAERSRLILWTPVFLGVGILVYFQLPSEPPMYFLLALPLFLVAGYVLYRVSSARSVLFLLPVFLILLGLNAGALRTALVNAPVLQKPTGNLLLHGNVIALSGTGSKKRLLIGNLSFSSPKKLPDLKYVRLNLRTKGADPIPGQYVSLKAVLLPPPSPVLPGGFDFQRQIFFQQIGAVGYVTSHPATVKQTEKFINSLEIWANNLRMTVTARVRAALIGDTAGFAVAIMTGDKSDIDKDTLDAMRNSGLAHLLAISGLHMGFIGGLIYFFLRLIAALFPAIALQFPVKKIAAVFAMLGIAFYLVLSGVSISALRAFIMAGLAFLAIGLDRNVFSMRMVVIAAIIVLLLLPESILGASFQMSFAAVFALIAVYESWGHKFILASRRKGYSRRIWIYFCGILLTTAVASIATAPFTVYHFGQLPLYGMVANLISVPIMGLWVMPMVLLSFITFPIGLEAFPLQMMAQGIDVIQQVARFVSDLPNAVLLVPSILPVSLFLITLSAMWFLLWRQNWRYCAIAGVIVAVTINAWQSKPDILISAGGQLLGYTDPSGQLYLSSGRREKFVQRKWKSRLGLRNANFVKRQEYDKNSPINCDSSGCVISLKNTIIAYSETREAIVQDCRRADVIISPIVVNLACKRIKTVIDKFSFMNNGAYALTLMPDGRVNLTSANQLRGDRPWVSKN